jgi:DNA mismatch repair ATPase MutS
MRFCFIEWRFFRDTFDEDAEITSKVCGIDLTKRNYGAGGETPLAVSHHQLKTTYPNYLNPATALRLRAS